jgi:hypothetical protein
MAYNIRSAQDLFTAVCETNKKFYKPSSENIIYLEELCNENFIEEAYKKRY